MGFTTRLLENNPLKFIMLVKGPDAKNPPKALFDAIDGLLKEAGNKMVWTGGFKNSASAAIARPEGGKVRVTDGPFTEAKELIGGFALMNVDSREETIALTKRFLEIAGDGESEIIEMFVP